MLTLHILNVRHGDAIIVEYHGKSDTVFGVIDSNRIGNDDPPALKKLRELGAQRLSFIALTHPHKDHYKGLLDIFEAYRGRISTFYTFPLDHHRQGRLKKLATIYQHLYNTTDSPTIRSSLKEFVKILLLAKESVGLENWEEPVGFYSILTPVGFEGVEIAAILPPSKVKSTYFQMIEKGTYDIVERQRDNNLSLAFSLQYKGKQIILGGDGTFTNWMYRQQLFTNRGGQVLKSNAATLPHHGSKENCHSKVVDHLFSLKDEKDKFACISANGRSHPHPDVFVTLEERSIKPFCTNLADQCGERMTDLLILAPDIEPQFLRYLILLCHINFTLSS